MIARRFKWYYILLPSAGSSHDASRLPRSTSSLPRSSPFSPLLAKFEDHHIIEFNSGTIIAGIGEAPLEDTSSKRHSEEDLNEGVQFEEVGTSQPSMMSLSTTGTSIVHGDMKYTTGDYWPLQKLVVYNLLCIFCSHYLFGSNWYYW